MDIEQILDRIYALSESSKLILRSHITELTFTKNFVIIQQDRNEKDFTLSKMESPERILKMMAVKLHFPLVKRAIPSFLSKATLPMKKDMRVLNRWKIVRFTDSTPKI